MDNSLYQKHLKEELVKYESICKRCGVCCGTSNDPCSNLAYNGDGKYSCRVYDTRLGIQKTVSGKIFTCVPIKDNIRNGFVNPNCAYQAP